jgi:hypothetical protein
LPSWTRGSHLAKAVWTIMAPRFITATEHELSQMETIQGSGQFPVCRFSARYEICCATGTKDKSHRHSEDRADLLHGRPRAKP